jgi:Ankyrin repeats (3 copies)
MNNMIHNNFQRLDWTQRPTEAQEKISSSFESLMRQTHSQWGCFNGSKGYYLCGVDEYALMKRIILDAPKEKKEFYALDIGAGNFQWGEGLAEYLNQQIDLPKDIKVHIIGIRGESNFGEREIQLDRCTLHNLGAFKVEELFQEFRKQRLELENKIDLAVSSWTFRHLVDPVGTFAQIYNLLCPRTGFLLLDGFFFLLEKDKCLQVAKKNMLQLFLDTKAPFIQYWINSQVNLNGYLLKRPDAEPCSLPMSYMGVESAYNYDIGSRQVMRFRRENQETEKCIQKGVGPDQPGELARGDKKTYDWLKKHNLISLIWNPLKEKEVPLSIPPLHRAVLDRSRSEIEAGLARGEDIDEMDATGSTALHIAIQQKDYDLFKFLLEKKPRLDLCNIDDYTPLQLAASLDTEGRIVQEFIARGANINPGENYWKMPLTIALEKKNKKAAEVLIDAGAKIFKENLKDLEELGFLIDQLQITN